MTYQLLNAITDGPAIFIDFEYGEKIYNARYMPAGMYGDS